jgi:DNA-binding PadR family transcriptional regulator
MRWIFSVLHNILDLMGKGEYLGEFEQIVLLAVARQQGRGYGMTLRREIESRAGRNVSIAPVYAALRRLELKGHVRSYAGAPTPIRGGRATRHFEILPAGVRALKESRVMLDRMWKGLQFRPQQKTT